MTALVLSMATGAQAQATLLWDGTTSTNWNTPSNWSDDAVPTASDDAVVDTVANAPEIGANVIAQAARIDVGNAAEGELSIAGGGSLVSERCFIGDDASPREQPSPQDRFLRTPIRALRWPMTHPAPTSPAASAQQSAAHARKAALPDAAWHWTTMKAQVLLGALQQTGCVAEAARGAGMTRQSSIPRRPVDRLFSSPLDIGWPLGTGRA